MNSHHSSLWSLGLQCSPCASASVPVFTRACTVQYSTVLYPVLTELVMKISGCSLKVAPPRLSPDCWLRRTANYEDEFCLLWRRGAHTFVRKLLGQRLYQVWNCLDVSASATFQVHPCVSADSTTLPGTTCDCRIRGHVWHVWHVWRAVSCRGPVTRRMRNGEETWSLTPPINTQHHHYTIYCTAL